MPPSPRRACRKLALLLTLAYGLLTYVTPAPAFQTKEAPLLQYPKHNPFGNRIHICTDKLYEQNDRGKYVYRGISFISQATFNAVDETLSIGEVLVFGKAMKHRQTVSYYKLERRDDLTVLLEWSRVVVGETVTNHLRIVTQRNGASEVSDLLPEDNYLTLLLEADSRQEMYYEIERQKKTYDRVRMTVLVSNNQTLPRFGDLQPVRIRLAVDVRDVQVALRQMIEMSYAGIKVAEALKKGRQQVRECN